MDKTTCDICGEIKECQIKHYDLAPDVEYDSCDEVVYTTADLVEGEGYEIAICDKCLALDDLNDKLIDLLNDFK